MLSVNGSDQLKAAVLGLKAADRDIRNDINRSTRELLAPSWEKLLLDHAWSALDRAVIVKGGRIKPGNPPTAIAATSKRKLSGGLVPVDRWHAIEFGADQSVETTYTRKSKRGGTHTVTRHTRTGLPARTPKGRVAYPAFAELAPRAVSLWVALIVRKFNEAAEKGAR